MHSAADVEPFRAVSGDPPGVADGRSEPALDETVDERAVWRVWLRVRRIVEEREERGVQLEPHVVVQPPHHADPDSFDVDARIERPARTADAELVLRHEFRRLAQIHP